MKLSKSELSILIPTYNYDPTPLVEVLTRQAKRLESNGLRYEIIVGDDGSTKPITPPCNILRMEHNTGRAAIRNALARNSKYEWLLFIDSDMEVKDAHFLENYLTYPNGPVVDGGISVGTGPVNNLRYLYEKSAEPRHIAAERARRPYQSFRTTNFMVARDVMLKHPFDERFQHYGYEDVLFGKHLKLNNIHIEHIEAPVVLTDFETNPVFVAKTEEAMRTLHAFRTELTGYSGIIRWSRLLVPRCLWRALLRMVLPVMRRRLCGSHPSVLVYNIYRIGYFTLQR